MKTTDTCLNIWLPLVAILTSGIHFASGADARRALSLNGTWQVAEGKLNTVPTSFDHTVPVPGLLDMATPPFEKPGTSVPSEARKNYLARPADPLREAFWYRRTFKVEGALPAVALLKVHKAKYGAKVLVNGQTVGEHAPNFTPGWFDVRPYLKADGTENELVIRVGASVAQVPRHLTEGWDFEKSRYIPGIFDAVELILSGTPHIINVQTVPNITKRAVHAVVELSNSGTKAVNTSIEGVVREVKSGRVAGKVKVKSGTLAAGITGQVSLDLKIKDGHLWTPEDPFLYELEISTGTDTYRTRFGLRTFTTDPKTGWAYLNGKRYYLRGSNVCIYRFFEDSERGTLPWDANWVRDLHHKFKEMHWNSLRYCIGFPPEFWYDIADEEGILIQDEFPIWYGGAKNGWPETITPEHLAIEYTEWMRERWNHPCVVIWDAQNETSDDKVIAAAIGKVRGLDLSHRPWDNGWGTPQAPGDISESHPYRASRPGFNLANLGREKGIPDNGPRNGMAKPPYLINEYGWLWINRDGTLPTLTVEVYKRLLGENATVTQRFEYYARTLAAKTEFWRVRRQCAGVLHFCGLGYSRHDGQTSDNFSDVQHLKYETNFFRFVRDAFAPVGVAVDWWEIQVEPGAKVTIPVRIINDLEPAWRSEITLQLVCQGKVLSSQTQTVSAPSWELGTGNFDLAFPTEVGLCELMATIRNASGSPITSQRTVRVEKTPENLALNRPVKASSEVRNPQGFFPATQAVDGKMDTYWSTAFQDNQWLQVELVAPEKIKGVHIHWQKAFAKAFKVQISTDGTAWNSVYTTENSKGGVNEITFTPVMARYVRIDCTKRGTQWGNAICELKVFQGE